jgi:hypothetical protein
MTDSVLRYRLAFSKWPHFFDNHVAWGKHKTLSDDRNELEQTKEEIIFEMMNYDIMDNQAC